MTIISGKAAFNIRGLTLHTTFRLPLNGSELKKLDADSLNAFVCKYYYLKLVIIDEISMVECRMLSHIESRLREFKKCESPFGGIDVIVFGDLNQLRPIFDGWIFEPVNDTGLSIIAGTTLWRQFRFHELTEIMRQKEDAAFANALNRLATGQSTENDDTMFRSRENTNPNRWIWEHRQRLIPWRELGAGHTSSLCRTTVS